MNKVSKSREIQGQDRKGLAGREGSEVGAKADPMKQRC